MSGNDKDFVIIPLNGDRLRKVSQALSNETAVRILEKLVEKLMSASELSEDLNIPLTSLKYHIDALLEAELIKVNYVGRSEKGREIKYYAPVKHALILMPGRTEGEVISFLRKILPAIVVVALSIPTGLLVRDVINSYMAFSHEIYIDPTNVSWYSFVVGTLFAMIALIFLTWLTSVLRAQKSPTKFWSELKSIVKSKMAGCSKSRVAQGFP